MTRATRTLCLFHLAGNALLLWLGYYWLGVGESSTARLAWSALVALALGCLTLWLHGAAFAYFRASDRSSLTTALRTALRSLPPLVVLGIAALGIYLLLAWWRDYSSQPAFKIASYLTLKLRKPLKPAAVWSAFNVVLWLVRWVALPVILLPLAAEVAGRGWSGFRGEAWKLSNRKLYWVGAPLLLLCALWVPFRLILWAPRVSGFGMEMTSFLIRQAVAYLLFVGAWLLLEFLSSGGRPLLSQVKTADSP